MGANFAHRRLGKELTKVCTFLCVPVCARTRKSPPQSWSIASLGPHPIPATTLKLRFNSRGLTELPRQITGNLPAGISLVSADDLETWYLDIKVLDNNPLYPDVYRLMFRFGHQYPIGKEPHRWLRSLCEAV